MYGFTKIIAGTLLGSAVVLPYLASSRGWGLESERNIAFMKKMANSCPSYARDSFGKCRRNHRSIYGRRSYYGGGPRSGK